MKDTFYCYSCRLAKPMLEKHTMGKKTGRRVICTSCKSKRQKPQRLAVA